MLKKSSIDFLAFLSGRSLQEGPGIYGDACEGWISHHLSSFFKIYSEKSLDNVWKNILDVYFPKKKMHITILFGFKKSLEKKTIIGKKIEEELNESRKLNASDCFLMMVVLKGTPEDEGWVVRRLVDRSRDQPVGSLSWDSARNEIWLNKETNPLGVVDVFFVLEKMFKSWSYMIYIYNIIQCTIARCIRYPYVTNMSRNGIGPGLVWRNDQWRAARKAKVKSSD